VDQIVTTDPRLTVPHPRAHERAFVLMPWLALDRDAAIPGRGPVRALLARLADQNVLWVAGPPPVPR
jgi:7,8-dihydro-6-hydroxymethylpterin-pyrophosphokinase